MRHHKRRDFIAAVIATVLLFAGICYVVLIRDDPPTNLTSGDIYR